MHTVIAEDCTGCELCIAPCPVDCIEMIMPAEPLSWSPHDANRARQQFMARATRLEKPSVGSASPPADQLTAILARAQQRGAERAK
jgi:electron transport complex protein RnfB